MKSLSDLPEIDFGAADYLAAPLPVPAKYATKFKLGRSKRGIEVFDYNLCRDTILSRYFGTGHPYRWHPATHSDLIRPGIPGYPATPKFTWFKLLRGDL